MFLILQEWALLVFNNFKVYYITKFLKVEMLKQYISVAVCRGYFNYFKY